mgnify:CR=1 FL=1
MDLARESLHVSVELLWSLENYMCNTKNITHDALGYLRAARVLLELQRLIFRQDLPDREFSAARRSIGRALEVLGRDYQARPLCLPYSRTGPALVAFGCVVASACCPRLVSDVKELVLMQGRKESLLNPEHGSGGARPSPSRSAEGGPPSTSNASSPGASPVPSSRASHVYQLEGLGPSLEDLSNGRAFSFKRYITLTAKSLIPRSASVTRASPESGAAQDFKAQGAMRASPASLFPPIPLYYHSDMQFVTSLVNVSDRLQSYDKGGRIKALHAELCLLNHNLPASLCLHTWCDGCHGQGHHRILSILPYESMVLNSAERVPYILFVEIVNNCTEEEFSRIIERRTASSIYSISNKSISTTKSAPSASDSETAVSQDRLAMLSASYYEDKIATTTGIVDVAERMRTAAVMLAQLSRQSRIPHADVEGINTIRSRIIHEMESLEKDRIVDALQSRRRDSASGRALHASNEQHFSVDPQPVMACEIKRQDPSAPIFQENWDRRKARLARASEYSHLPGWDVLSVIVKSSTDMRQEHLAYQIVRECCRIFEDCGVPVFLFPYRVLVASGGGGLIETIPNAISVHSVKKSILLSLGIDQVSQEAVSLKAHFLKTYGATGDAQYHAALDNFISSLAGYSLLTYLLQVRDRHNGNILLDNQGHLIHIDFGFMLSNSPGYVGFETAPFKMTAEYVDLLDGVGSEYWQQFRRLFTQGLLTLRKHSDRLITMLELLMKDSTLPCFYAGEAALLQFKDRFHMNLTDQQMDVLIDRLMTNSTFNVFTRLYDSYQYYTNGIL